MSCFNCYSSRKVEVDLVDEVLERGQRLRSAMVQTILNNAALNLDINGPVCGAPKPDLGERNIKAFLQGDSMSKEDEVQTMETLRSMSAVDLCKITDRTYQSNDPCDCLTCLEYCENDLSCDRKRSDNDNQLKKRIQKKYKHENASLLKMVDAIKIAVESVTLTESGEKKIKGHSIKDKAINVTQTFFLEYQIPESVTKKMEQVKEKINKQMNPIKIWAQRTQLETININNTSVHKININNLEDNIITFRLRSRGFRQRQSVPLGVAHFDISSLYVNKNLTCTQELCLKIGKDVVGVMKMSVQLGCGIYFGDAISNNKENSDVRHSGDFQVSNFQELTLDELTKLTVKLSNHLDRIESAADAKAQKPVNDRSNPKAEKTVAKPSNNLRKIQPTNPITPPISLLDQPKLVLLGFLYISRAQFLREVSNSYVSCNLFGEDEIVNSKPIAFESCPAYNFSQRIPLIYEDKLVLGLRENCMVIEIREKGQTKDFLVGISKVSLHPFYLACRNSIVVKYLSEKEHPSIAVDGWEDIIDPSNDEIVGKLEILLALGTKEQIDNLEKERGFKKGIVSLQSTTDVGIQAENMEPKNDIEKFLKEIVAQNQQTVETATAQNQTEAQPKVRSTANLAQPQVRSTADLAQPQVRSTTDLLDSLQKAFDVADKPEVQDFFKANVFVENALHLPSRKKCRSKRNKSRTNKHEDILPSTYVTFETYEGDIKITDIVPKSTTPNWNYKCDVNLPVELLTNKQKSFIFKIWKKSTNTTMVPNRQTDHVIGFAAVDLTVLLSGLPTVQGWYNINDLSKKCNGQINIHVSPLESLQGFQAQKDSLCCTFEPVASAEVIDEPGELLNRALKRKFTELDEITQRLRLRLSKVTDESDTSNDETADEFERDINTLCVEDDFDMLNFEQEARKFSLTHVREIGLLQTDKEPVSNKQKIDVLLEKLSLISGENSSRYVSGCSRSPVESEECLESE